MRLGIAVILLVGLVESGCSGGKEESPPHPIEAQRTFQFEDGTTKTVAEMQADPDCAALLPKVSAGRQLSPGRGLKISVREESRAVDKAIYCWSGD